MGDNLQPTATFVNGEVSFWYREPGLPTRRAALPGDVDVDVAIVGAGFTGLWTAYYLARWQPDLRIAVLEKEFAGFGASGRNGGWLSAEPPGQLSRYADARGLDAAVRLQREMFASVDEVIQVAASEGVDADIRKDGLLRVATNLPQHRRLLARIPTQRRFGWGHDDLVALDADQVRSRVAVAGAQGGTWSPHCARIQPAKLVRGLAAAVERKGVTVYEDTVVTAIRPGRVTTPRGLVSATYVLRALEGFTAGLPGHRRSWLPMNSSMLVTEPLSADAWVEIGWRGTELVGDEAHAFAYCQRTEDGRIALGGRGIPYRYGSRWDDRGRIERRTLEQLRETVGRLFPAAASAGVDHAWAGVLAVPRDWCATVGLDHDTGLGWAGGYVGHGVTSTNLAGRTLADLVLRRDSDLVDLPWVGRHVRRWEVEPARWVGVRGLYLAYRAADRREQASRSGRTSLIATVADRLSGR